MKAGIGQVGLDGPSACATSAKQPDDAPLVRSRRKKMTAKRLLLYRRSPHCHWCGVETWLCNPVYHDVVATVEHLVPVSRGGSDDLSNLALACQKCNTERGNSLGPPVPRRPAVTPPIHKG